MDTRITLRLCVPADAAALSLVGQATFLDAFAGTLDGADILGHCARQHSLDFYVDFLARDRACAWLAEAAPGGAPVGFLLLAPADLPIPDPSPDDLEVKRIYLLTRFHRGGLGRRLMDEAIAEARRRGCRRLLLGVYGGNAAAIAFYERVGFTRAGTRTFRVGDHDYQDLVLALAIDPAAP